MKRLARDPVVPAAADPSAVDRDENYGWRPSAFGRLPLGDLTDLVGTRMPLKVAASRTIMLRFEYVLIEQTDIKATASRAKIMQPSASHGAGL